MNKKYLSTSNNKNIDVSNNKTNRKAKFNDIYIIYNIRNLSLSIRYSNIQFINIYYKSKIALLNKVFY